MKHIQWKLLEARPILGGRLVNDSKFNEIDLGGAWIWDSQPNINSLVTGLQIETFRQPDDPSSTRIVGGAAAIVQKLASTIPNDSIQLSTPVVKCSLITSKEEGPYVELTTANDSVVRARHVVFAAPPKLLSKHIQFDPPLNSQKQRAMEASRTWMAGKYM